MKTAHLTDMEIQLYLADPDGISDELTSHVQECPRCNLKASNYKLLFQGMKNQPQPTFDFDLSALVVEKLPEPRPSFPWLVVLSSILSIAIVSLSLMLFWSAILGVIRSVSFLLLAATGTGALIIFLFQGLEMLKVHHKQMNRLLKSKILQL